MLDPRQFSIVAEVESHHALFLSEGTSLSTHDFARWPQHEAYVGEFLVFPLLLCGFIPGLDVDLVRNQRLCPASTDTLLRIARVRSAGFARLEPGSRVLSHRDGQSTGILRMQLPLRIPKGAWLRVAGQAIKYREGKGVIVDGTLEHETGNPTDRPRLLLILDFAPTPREKTLVLAEREKRENHRHLL